ncbi:MAG: response regulator [Anaerolineae bacterium]
MEQLKHILIVDDDDAVLFILRDCMARLGDSYQICTAGNGREALRTIRDSNLDLLITDLKLPGMSGVELTAAFRVANKHTPVIWITAYGCHKMRDQAEELGVYRCLTKPLDVSEIRQVAREALDSAAPSIQDSSPSTSCGA